MADSCTSSDPDSLLDPCPESRPHVPFRRERHRHRRHGVRALDHQRPAQGCEHRRSVLGGGFRSRSGSLVESVTSFERWWPCPPVRVLTAAADSTLGVTILLAPLDPKHWSR